MIKQLLEAAGSDISTGVGSGVLSIKEIYLSLEGIVLREVYCLCSVLGLMIATFLAFGKIAGLASVGGDWFGFLVFPLYAIVVRVALALEVKRWHDRNKSRMVSAYRYGSHHWAALRVG